MKRRQTGVALLLALLIVAIATLISLRLFAVTSTSLARNDSQARLGDAQLLAQGMEDWALLMLRRDTELGDGIDTRNDSWASSLPPLPVPGGSVSGQLSDLDGHFNLNTLVRNGARDPVAQARFSRLLAALKLDTGIADAVTDWIDVDNQALTEGAEDLEYLRADPPYRAANRPMTHISELRLIKGVDAEAYKLLAPEVCALPADTGFNINTASVAGFMSLADGITADLARRLWQEGHASYRSMTELVDQLGQAGVMLDPAAMTDLKVSSNFFIARADVELSGHPFRFYSQLQRHGSGGRVIQRVQGAYD